MQSAVRLVQCFVGRMPGADLDESGRERWKMEIRGSAKMNKLERLRQLATSIRPLERDGQSLLYPDGDEACFCRYDPGADDPCDLAEFIELMQKTLPGLLDVCDAYRKLLISDMWPDTDTTYEREQEIYRKADQRLEELLK